MSPYLLVVTGRLAQIFHLYNLDYSAGTEKSGLYATILLSIEITLSCNQL